MLLAGLPVAEFATTNYDALFERACAAAGRPAAVLPYEPVMGHTRWLLKMHGSIDHPHDIVLTREDHLRYMLNTSELLCRRGDRRGYSSAMKG